MKIIYSFLLLILPLIVRSQISHSYIGNSGFSGFSTSFCFLQNGNKAIVGSRMTSTGDHDAFVTCVSPLGAILWSKEIRTTYNDKFIDVLGTFDSGCVAVGYVASPSTFANAQACIYKFDKTGTLLWNKIIEISSFGENFLAVVEVPGSHNLVCGGISGYGGSCSGLIMNLSSTGVINWTKQYYSNNQEIHGMGYLNGNIICSGLYRGSTYFDGRLFSVKEVDGTVNWNRTFDYASYNNNTVNTNYVDRLSIVDDKIYVDAYISPGFSSPTPSAVTSPSLLSFDTTGLMPFCLEYPIGTTLYPNVIHSKIVSKNEIYLFQNISSSHWERVYTHTPITAVTDVICTKIRDIANASGTTVFTRKIGIIGEQGLTYSTVKNGRIHGCGASKNDPTYLIGSQDIFMFEADTTLAITSKNCIVDVSLQNFGYPTITFNPSSTFSAISTPSFSTPSTPTVTSVTYTKNQSCPTSLFVTMQPNFSFTRTGCFNVSFKDLTLAPISGIKTWKWEFGDGGISSLQHPTHTYATYGTYNVKLILTDSSNNKDSVTKTLVISNSFASAGNDTTLCKISGGSTTSLLAKGGVSYSWTPSAGLSNPSIPNPLATITASTSYIVQVTDSFGCIDSDTIHITLEEGFANAGNDTTICLIGGVNTIKLNASGGVNYSWTPAAGLSNPYISNPIATITASTLYVVTVTTAAGCKETDLINITAGDFALTINDTTLCLVSGMAKIPLLASGGINYKWYPATGLSDTTIPNPTATLTTNTLYIVTVEDSFGCVDKDSVQINTSTATIKATHDTVAACEDVVVTLNASGGSSYDWQPPEGLSNNLIANPKLTVTKNQNYIVTGKNIFGCIDSDTVNIRLRVGVVDVIASPDKATGCNGDEIQLEAKGALYYSWEPKFGISDEKIPNPKLSVTGSRNYVVTGFDADGCKDSDTVSVTGFANPYVKATSVDILVDCYKDITLEAYGAVNYSWTPAVYAESNFSATTKVYPPATTVFTVRGWDENGCFGEDTITVFYQGKTLVKIPSAFTPNNDQLNDRIKPIIVCDFTMTEFSIYNRWGNMVFTTNSVSIPWDGTFKGKECEMGTYFYFLKGKNGKNEEVFFKGDITLIR